ncbi:hypothetical protein BJ508DRAFT_326648 [Ascobolus immersus RN42]|uniref:Uncharacterized protein n=1 Tax=Ascobolus immersus RN42 TaxID=1160509 RepID=A0A3N4I725_ASCIM|nr:hypothetical protein BJ508DRAFT_326648 [Ascobolus immersus RN42]
MRIQRVFKNYPATVEEYPSLASTEESNPAGYGLTRSYLTPNFRLRKESGPVTLRDILEPNDETRLYLDIVWEHPPASRWHRWLLEHHKHNMEFAGHYTDIINDYYVKLARLLFGEEHFVRKPHPVDSWPRGCCRNTGNHPYKGYGGYPEEWLVIAKEWYVESCASFLTTDIAGERLETVNGVCMFEVLKAIEVDRLIREERQDRKAKRNPHDPKDVSKRSLDNGPFQNTSREDWEYLSHWIDEWEKWQKYSFRGTIGKFKRCVLLEYILRKYLGMPMFPRRFETGSKSLSREWLQKLQEWDSEAAPARFS